MKNCRFFIILLCVLLFAIPVTYSQVAIPYFGTQELINGYERSLQGETIPYFSVYPKFAREALLTRSTDGHKSIEWETDVIPADVKGDYAYFTWIAAHSTGSSGGPRHFDLYINDEFALTFTTFPKQYPPYWTFASQDSMTRLVFDYKKKDAAGDAHGMAYLRVPVAKYQKGKPLKLRVVGQEQNSNDWYMTFTYSFKEKVEIIPLPFLLKGGPGTRQPVQITVLHFGGPEKLDISIGQDIKQQFAVVNGFNVYEADIPSVKERTSLPVKASIGKVLDLDTNIVLSPVIYREIDLVHHAHTDIGYSHIQEDVVQIHVENIKRALRLIERTKDYPQDSKFKWNIESAWAVENFLGVADEKERQQFFAAVRNKQMVISATYANILTGLCTPEEMDWITEYARGLRDNYKLPVNTAMMSDVPGMSWSMVPALARNGVRYFSNGPNYVEGFPDKGDRVGHIIRDQGNKAFWWISSTGRDSILFWTCGKGYSSWHGFAQGAIKDRGAEKIAACMNELAAINYPYSMVQWRYNVVADNGPTDSTISDFVRDWNEKYSSPKLVLANVSDMFERFEKLYGKTIPVLSGDLTPYWEDGAYSTAKEETDTRLASERLLQLENLAAQKHIHLDKDWAYQAKKNIILFHEHTWGAWCSISKPDDPFTIHQWLYKKRFADSAVYFVDRLEEKLRMTISPAAKPLVTVVNTLPWVRSGYVEMQWPSGFSGTSLTDDKGKRIAIQKNEAGKLCFVATGIPAKGERNYRFSTNTIDPAHTFQPVITIGIDSTSGAIKKINTLNREWVDNTTFSGVLQALYVKGRNPAVFSPSVYKKLEWVENGPVLKKCRITCSMDGTNEVVYEISEYNGLNYLLVSAIIDKKAIRDKESIHIAFPFALPAARVRIGTDEHFISPEHGQIPGSNKDFFSVQRWIDVSDSRNGVTITCPQGALFEVGSMINEELVVNGYKKWKDSVQSSPTIFLYAMNNYWHTNYKADQEGKVRFDFYLSFHKEFDAAKAGHFGYISTQPLIGY